MVSLSSTSRFLMQATPGFGPKVLEQANAQGPQVWLAQQLDYQPADSAPYEAATSAIWSSFKKDLVKAHGEAAINGDGNNPALAYKWYFHMAWWQHLLSRDDDLLRQRTAQALSEVLVISDKSALELNSVGMANYYDLLYRYAFGSYVDLLTEVALHPMMGIYLSHMNNRKADPARNIHPDENFAREIMQLFSIGLFELNKDGSRRTDGAGNDIPTYDNRDIKELARVFTGLLADSYQYEWETSFWDESFNGYPVAFEDGIEKTYKTVPFITATKSMQVDENYHDRGPKNLLKGQIKLPGGQDGVEEIRSAVRQLVAHPSTAPFIARNLINQMVSSNPSAAYITAVAEAFGPEGDLKETIRTILTWPLENEVSDMRFGSVHRDAVTGKSVQSQKLKSPLLRVTQLLKAFGAHNNSGKMWVLGDDIDEFLSQHPLSSPTVFNFYKPDFVPHGPLEVAKLVAPEFELHTSATSIGYVNLMYYWFFGERLPLVSNEINRSPGIFNVPEMEPDVLWANDDTKLQLDFSPYMEMAADEGRHDELIDQMSLLLCGKKDLAIKPFIKSSYQEYRGNPLWVIQTIAFLLAISPDFTVQEA